MIRHQFFSRALGERVHRCARCHEPTPTVRDRQNHAALLRLPHVEVAA